MPTLVPPCWYNAYYDPHPRGGVRNPPRGRVKPSLCVCVDAPHLGTRYVYASVVVGEQGSCAVDSGGPEHEWGVWLLGVSYAVLVVVLVLVGR